MEAVKICKEALLKGTRRETRYRKGGFPNAGSPDGWDEKFSNQTAMMMNEAYIKRMNFP
jgi:hypothetical protein